LRHFEAVQGVEGFCGCAGRARIVLRKDIARVAGYCVTLVLVFMLATGQLFTDAAGNIIESPCRRGRSRGWCSVA
jgi:hypothetical protein